MKRKTAFALGCLAVYGVAKMDCSVPAFNPSATDSFKARGSPHSLAVSWPSPDTLPGRPVNFWRMNTDNDPDYEAFVLYEDGSRFYTDGPLVGRRGLTYTRVEQGPELYEKAMNAISRDK